jgi:hypothetical protein
VPTRSSGVWLVTRRSDTTTKAEAEAYIAREKLRLEWEALCEQYGPAWKAANPYKVWLMLEEHERYKRDLEEASE